jgi:endonuclease/exonuclease/phosphatase family metal-dependent hydrolase
VPYYYSLKFKYRDRAERKRVIENLCALRDQLDETIPDKDAEQNLLLATWNIRDFDKRDKSGRKSRRGFGERLPESHHYIAEVLSRFDFVAVQEINDLEEWETVMKILGPDWDNIATDVTDPALGGNGERLTFVYDKRKVWFRNIAGEIVLPASMLISKVEAVVHDEPIVAGKQFRRTPFLASFQSGWFRFDICTVHLYYGDRSGPQLQERIEEIDRVAGYLGKRADRALAENKALILLGDFNIVHPEHGTMQALLDQGFVVPKPLLKPTNIDRTKHYDQIAFKTKPEVIEYVERRSQNPKKRNAGIVELFDTVFTDDDFDQYAEHARKTPNGKRAVEKGELEKYYRTWRTYQFSDHKPMWVRLSTNDSQAYLDKLKGSEPVPADHDPVD